MNVEVRLFAYFRDNRGKKQFLTLEEGTTVEAVVAQLAIDKGDIAILLRNGRDTTFETVLQDEDVLALFPPVGGG